MSNPGATRSLSKVRYRRTSALDVVSADERNRRKPEACDVAAELPLGAIAVVRTITTEAPGSTHNDRSPFDGK